MREGGTKDTFDVFKSSQQKGVTLLPWQLKVVFTILCDGYAPVMLAANKWQDPGHSLRALPGGEPLIMMLTWCGVGTCVCKDTGGSSATELRTAAAIAVAGLKNENVWILPICGKCEQRA